MFILVCEVVHVHCFVPVQAWCTRSQVGAANDGHGNLPGEGAGGGHPSHSARVYGGVL